jgi:hypothetical protein
MSNSSRTTLFILLAVLLIVYIRYCWRFPSEIVIIQVPATGYSPDLLLEKQPLILDSISPDPESQARRMLGHLSVHSSPAHRVTATAVSRSAWTALFLIDAEEATVTLVRPATQLRLLSSDGRLPPSVPSVQILLRKGQVLLVPFQWAYACPDLHAVSFWDMLHTAALPFRFIFGPESEGAI